MNCPFIRSMDSVDTPGEASVLESLRILSVEAIDGALCL